MIWTLFAMAASAQTLQAAKFDVTGRETQVTLTFDETLTQTPRSFTIERGTPRFVVDFTDAKAEIEGESLGNGQRQVIGKGAVKDIRYAVRAETDLRLVFDLNEGAAVTHQDVKGASFVLKFTRPNAETNTPMIHLASARTTTVQSSGIREFPGTPYPRLQPGHRIAKKPIIVIDPGHGGYDPGAVGTKGTLEKTITFKAAKNLRSKLLATGRYDVIMTRSTDTYIDHEERLRIARAGGADLFISIHADSAGNNSARGASVYTLSDRSKNRSRNVTNTQNWVLDVDLTEQSDTVGNILVDLAQRSTFSQSAEFAKVLLPELEDTTRLVGNSHRRAGYYVLLAPDVPAVLLELGFLSNADDEKLLRTEKHRNKIMKSVTKAINTYFDNQTP